MWEYAVAMAMAKAIYGEQFLGDDCSMTLATSKIFGTLQEMN